MTRKLLTILSCMLISINVLAENTKTIDVTFANFPAGSQFADNEEHILSDELTIYTTDCHFTTELRIYSSSTYNGYVISDPLPSIITKMTFNIAYASGYGKDVLNVYGSIDGIDWELIKALSVESTVYREFSVSPKTGLNFRCFKLDVKGDNQLRIKSMSVTYAIDEEESKPTEPEAPTEPTISNDGSESNPYTVTEVKNKTSFPQKPVYVKGIICGALNDNYNNLVTSNFKTSTNIALTDATTYIAVKLTDDIKPHINLVTHPYLLGKEMLILGNLSNYFGVPGVINPTEYKITYDVLINRYGYASLYLDMPVKVPEGCIAYYCTTEEDQVHLHPVGDIIPNNMGVIIAYEPNSTCTLTYTTETNSNEEHILSNNQLVGFAKDTLINSNGYSYYALNAKGDLLGFYIPQTAADATDAASEFTAKANKAYLRVPTEHEVTMFVIHRENDLTEISPIDYTSKDVFYNLQGHMTYHPTQGIYIQNGKKIIIK